MPEIKPLRAWRYNSKFFSDISDLTSPLFDVISEKQRKKLYDNPYNSIHLSVPKGDNPNTTAKETMDAWKKEQIILQDRLPGFYVYYQYYSLPGNPKEYCRKGFVCNMRLHEWKEIIILRHESTIPRSVNDRASIIESTLLNSSPTHGLYTDPEFVIEHYLDESMKNPIYESEDYQGVRDVLSVIHDLEVIKKIITLIHDKQIILADGHHRYEGSLAYRRKAMKSNPQHKGDEGYNFHMMYLTNTESDHLRILPTHRMVKGIPNLTEDDLINKLSEYFIIKNIPNVSDVYEVILGKKWAFGLLIDDNAYKIRLKPDKIAMIDWNFPKEIKEMDLTVMHYFVFEKVLGIPGKQQRHSLNITFERNFTECHIKVIKEAVQFAIITKDIPMETVKRVCYSGYTLPQKATYFYPKVICGYLFSSIKDDEFKSPIDSSLKISP